MDEEKKITTGAPSSDTTSALFVSARKKQLEQQENERRIKEKEERRMAAEAQVQRLEQEVEERRRRAEEESKKVEAENAQRKLLAEEDARNIAEEARVRKAQALENPDAILGVIPQKKERKLSIYSKLCNQKNKISKKQWLIIGGVTTVVVAFLVLLLTFGGDKEISDKTKKNINVSDIESNNFNAIGTYYDSDSETSISFYEDGNMEFQDWDGSLAYGEYTVKEDTITIKYNELEYVLVFYNADILMDSDDVTYERVIDNEYAWEDESEDWYMEPYAALDSLAVIEGLGMGLAYPSTQVYLYENTQDHAYFMSFDDQSMILVDKLIAYESDDGSFQSEDLMSVKDAMLESYEETIAGGVVVTENSSSVEDNVAYFKMTYNSDGKTLYMCSIFGGWNNERDNSRLFWSATVICPAEQTDEYMKLFDGIYNSRADN